MDVCVVGLGYIGLPTAVLIASSGMEVYGYDINRDLVEKISSGQTDIQEEGLKEMLQSVIGSGKLSVGTEIRNASIFVLAVSTSLDEEKMGIDLRALRSAVKDVGKVLKKGDLVIVESTVTPGTMEELLPILERESGMRCCSDFYLAFCPERVLPGNLMRELVHNDRIIGGMCPESSKRAADFYSRFVKGKLHMTDARTAEMAKLMENTYRAVNIALANEMALIAEKKGVDVYEAIRMANNHPRVNIHMPGPGVGGYCLTKDPWFLIEDFEESRIIKDALELNASMPVHVADMVEEELEKSGKKIEGAKIAVLGLAYKGNVYDPRNSPGYEIYAILRERGADVHIHDPYVAEYHGLEPERDLHKVMDGVDVAVIVTDHRDYAEADWLSLYSRMSKEAVIIDTRNIVSESGSMRIRKLGVGI